MNIPQTQLTPLMQASRVGNVEIARLLLDNGADPNLTNDVNTFPFNNLYLS